MVLSDREIRAAIERKALLIVPDPPPEAWTSTAVDLTLDKELRRWKVLSDHGKESVIRPLSKNFNFTALAKENSEAFDISADGWTINPGDFVLGWTVERIQLPYKSRIAARVEGKSSLARLGVGVHVTAPTIHAGFGYNPQTPDKGNTIQLEIHNVGPLSIKLEKGMAICQLIFEEVHGTPEKGYEGQFAKQH